MGAYEDQYWESADVDLVPNRDRRFGPYRSYRPDLLSSRSLVFSAELSRQAAVAESAILAAGQRPGARSLEGMSRFLLRSEAVASSLIEGIAPSPQQVALAELAQDEDVRGFSDQARLVANNITVLRHAADALATTEAVTVDDVVHLHSALLPDDRHRGLRSVQNWIGGSSWHPLDADYVPPPASQVAELMVDLVAYLNGSLHAPLVQAALVHAQFETIHPFTDGNGRVGRALIHTVLTRRGLTSYAVLPISLVLSTLRGQYVSGLSAYRTAGDPADLGPLAGVETWLSTFFSAALVAAQQATKLAGEIGEVRADWQGRLATTRSASGKRATPRSGSATERILALLTEAPVMTTATAQRLLTISFPAARGGLEELAEAGILQRKTVDRGATAYIARDVLELITWAERRLGSTQFDTRVQPPNRSVPARPPG